jgi:myo-inositol-1(or 4)-monophosphatase
MSSLLERALAAARSAGELLSERPAELTVTSKSSSTDAVTAMDRASENLLIELLLSDEGASDAVLGEEGGERPGTSDVRWVIDPLDGTVNYLYGIPEWAVSVAAQVAGRPTVGVVLSPALDMVWWAEVGEGAWCQRGEAEPQRISVGKEHRLAHALIGTGFGYLPERRRWQAALLAEVIPHIRDVRRAGAAAIDLCRVADGTLDGYFEKGLQPWDLAAGEVIVAEAGGRVSGWHTEPAGESMVIAANQQLLPQLGSRLTAARHELDCRGLPEI